MIDLEEPKVERAATSIQSPTVIGDDDEEQQPEPSLADGCFDVLPAPTTITHTVANIGSNSNVVPATPVAAGTRSGHTTTATVVNNAWSAMMRNETPIKRLPQLGNVKGKALYHAVKDIPPWAMMQDFSP